MALIRHLDSVHPPVIPTEMNVLISFLWQRSPNPIRMAFRLSFRAEVFHDRHLITIYSYSKSEERVPHYDAVLGPRGVLLRIELNPPC